MDMEKTDMMIDCLVSRPINVEVMPRINEIANKTESFNFIVILYYIFQNIKYQTLYIKRKILVLYIGII